MYLAASEIVEKVDEALLWIVGISVVLLLGITIAMIYLVIRYRRGRNPEATQIEGNALLETTWIVIPTLIVLFMFWKGYEGFVIMRDAPEGSKKIEVLAQMWVWTFKYPEEDIVSDRLFVPKGQPIKLELTSPADDVVHSFYLPAYRIKEDCVPGRKNYLWFMPEKEGSYNIFCAEYCGKDHSQMISELVVLSEADYKEWVKKKIADKNKPVVVDQAMDPESKEITAREAPKIFKTFCVSCHGEKGQGGLVEGARDFRKLDGWKRSPKITDIYRTLEKGVEGTQMRSFNNLPPWDRFALAHHVASLYKGSDRPESTREEVGALVKEYGLDKVPEVKETLTPEEAMKAIADELEAGEKK